MSVYAAQVRLLHPNPQRPFSAQNDGLQNDGIRALMKMAATPEELLYHNLRVCMRR